MLLIVKKIAAIVGLVAIILSLMGFALFAFAFSNFLQAGRWVSNPPGFWGHLLEVVFVLLVIGFIFVSRRAWGILYKFLSQ